MRMFDLRKWTVITQRLGAAATLEWTRGRRAVARVWRRARRATRSRPRGNRRRDLFSIERTLRLTSGAYLGQYTFCTHWSSLPHGRQGRQQTQGSASSGEGFCVRIPWQLSSACTGSIQKAQALEGHRRPEETICEAQGQGKREGEDYREETASHLTSSVKLYTAGSSAPTIPSASWRQLHAHCHRRQGEGYAIWAFGAE